MTALIAAPTADIWRSLRYLLCFVKPTNFSVTYCKPGSCGFRQSVRLRRRDTAPLSDRIRDSRVPRAVSLATRRTRGIGHNHLKHKRFCGSGGWHGILLISKKYG